MTSPRERARAIVRDGYPIGPRMHPCSCGAPRHQHAGNKFSGAHQPTPHHPHTGCYRYRRDTADLTAERAMEATRSHPLHDIAAWHTAAHPRPTPSPGGWGVGPSDVATCRRQIQYRERPPEGLIRNPVDESAAALGSMFHEAIRRARQALYPWRRYETQLDIPGLDRPGRMDEYDPLTAIGTDVKTLGEYAWDHAGEYGPKEEHWLQLAIYCYALTQSGHEVEVMELLLIRRATGEPEYHHRPYSEAYAKQALGRLSAIALALDMGTDLPRDGRGPTSDPICAKWCAFRDHCWNVPAATAAGRSPESWTILGEHPDAADIEWAADLALGWNANKKEADREYKAAIPLLGGVPNGTYGEFVVTERTRRMPEYKKFYEEVRTSYSSYLLTPDDERGDFLDWVARIPLPYRRDVWPEVKRVRVGAS